MSSRPARDSALRRGYPSLDHRQRLFLAAITIAIDSILVSYDRLVAELAIGDTPGEESAGARFGAEIVLDSWAIVDSAHRLVRLVTSMPGLSGRAPAIRIIVSALRPVEDLRHRIQHLDEQIGQSVLEDGKVAGMVGWVEWDGPPSKTYRLNSFMPSAQAPNGQNWMPVAFPLPRGRVVDVPVGLVTLYVGDVELCLTDVARAVERFAERLEMEVERVCSSLDPTSPGPVKVTLNPGAATVASGQE